MARMSWSEWKNGRFCINAACGFALADKSRYRGNPAVSAKPQAAARSFSQFFRHPLPRSIQCFAQLRGIFAAGFGLVGLAAATAADDGGNLLDEISRVQSLGMQIIGHDSA